MPDQPDTVKQNIIDWCNVDGIKFEDQSSKYPAHDWTLMINGKVAVYKQPRLPDRIYFHAGFSFTSEQQKLIQDNKTIKNAILLQVPSLLAQMNVNTKFEMNGDIMTGISLSKPHFHTTIKKADFLILYLRTQQVLQVLLNQLSVQLKISLQKLQQNQQKPPLPDASDVGIG